jgi:hypothetical protein
VDKQSGIAHIAVSCSQKDYAVYTKFRIATASPMLLGMIYRLELPMIRVHGRAEMCVISEQVAREFNLRCEPADKKMISADGYNRQRFRTVTWGPGLGHIWTVAKLVVRVVNTPEPSIWIRLVLATGLGRHFGSGYGSEPNRSQIGGPGCQ